MKRLVIYTCVCGGYDVVEAPLAVCPEADYICFSDRPMDLTVWQYRPAEMKGTDGASTSRWYKLNPHLALPEYEYSLWIDGNVCIASAELYDRIDELMTEGCLYAGLSHPLRDDIYDEAEAILKGRRESLHNLMKISKFLHKEGFPRHSSLMENNVILRAHNDPKIIASDTLWWDMYQKYSHRDQMSLAYCLWKNDVKPSLILPEGSCARNHPAFKYTVHDKPYVKDRSLRGIWKDAVCAFKKSFFHLFLRIMNS